MNSRRIRLLPNLAGELSNEAEISQLPNVPIEVGPKTLNKRDVVVYYLGSAITRVETNNKMLLYHISRFYGDKTGHRSMACDCVGALIGMLMNIAKPAQVLRGGIQNTFKDTGYIIDIRKISFRDLNELIDEDERYDRIAGLIGDFDHRISRERDLFLVLAAVIMLTLGKQINNEGYENWYVNRVKTFCGSLGYSHGSSVLVKNTKPQKDSMLACYQFLSATRTLRAEIFKVYIAASKNEERGMNIFKDICKLMYWTEMTHISLIDDMLYKKYPELLVIRILASQATPMMQAWAYLQEKAPEERKFCKLLFPKEETAVLNRVRFSLYCDAAFAAKQFEQPSLKNYKGNTQNEEIRKRVHYYLTLRTSLLEYGILDNENAAISDREKSEYLKLIVKDLDKETDDATVQRA